jgi:hypothetical protein
MKGIENQSSPSSSPAASRGGKLNLAAETVDVDARSEVGGQHLDDHGALQGPLARHKDPRHARPVELALEVVVAAQGCLQPVLKIAHVVSDGCRHREDTAAPKARAWVSRRTRG